VSYSFFIIFNEKYKRPEFSLFPFVFEKKDFVSHYYKDLVKFSLVFRCAS